MSPAGYTEDDLVEKPSIELLKQLGWSHYDAFNEFNAGPSPLGRETPTEVILTVRLRQALHRLNPRADNAAIESAINEITRDRSRMSMVAANRELSNLFIKGVGVKVTHPDDDSEQDELVQVIDWTQPANNDFLVCSQLWIAGDMHRRRADLIGFVNGLPLVFIELKAAHVRLEAAFNDNLRDYRDTIPQLFWANGVIILSNGSHSRIGSLTAGWEHFAEWKKVEHEHEQGRISLETMLRGVCTPARLLDVVENFTLFQQVSGGTIKLIAKNHQYLGVNNAITALETLHDRQGKLGVFWHTQGSGKSISMMFFSQKVLRTLRGNWTFVIITDRQELDRQIHDHFKSAGLLTEHHVQADSSQHLRQLLRENHRYVFTLIHKFRTEQGETHPVLSTRNDIIVITDEAHRSQYDTLALNMRTALPNAAFLAFTGTPLMTNEKTRDVFGDYISIYDFQQSVADGATVPLYYENRIPELQLVNPNLNEDMEALLESAVLDAEQEKRLEREFARDYHLITRDERLDAIAKDLVDHFTGRGFQGKAMMISIDKATAVRMHDKVKTQWQAKLDRLQQQRATAPANEQMALDDLIAFMQETDMAVVISQGQNEIDDLRKKGLDIVPHRERMNRENLESKFKDSSDPLRLVFVCAMWMTGFDVPSCSTLYLDKPMRNHTLMQTIARANRVYPGKTSGLIVDYVGVFRNLEQALAVYALGSSGAKPVEDKSVLVAALRQAIAEVKTFFVTHSINIEAIKQSSGFERIALLDDAVESIIATEDRKRQYIDLANKVRLLYSGILPDPNAREFSADVVPIDVIAQKIRALAPAADISTVIQEVEALLDRSIATEGYIIGNSTSGTEEGLIDLSNVDFAALAQKFKKGRKHTLNERIKASVEQRLLAMVRLNRTRMDYVAQFQQMIDAYNAGSLNAETFFHQLTNFAQTLNIEDHRAIGEQLSEEELAVFDLLTKPMLELSESERTQVKQAARTLLAKLKEKELVLDWRKRQQARANVRISIEETLDATLPPIYTSEMFSQKSAAVFQHIYDAYYGAGRSVYGGV